MISKGKGLGNEGYKLIWASRAVGPRRPREGEGGALLSKND